MCDELIYHNPLACPADVEGFVMEGAGGVSFLNGRLRLYNLLDPREVGEQGGNFVFWCPAGFPGNFRACWRFRPIREPGLCMLFFCARGAAGEDLFDPALRARSGVYRQYNNSDIAAYHLSYFRRRLPEERVFHTCNLRKSPGAHLAALGADPLPGAADAADDYRLALEKRGGHIAFSIAPPGGEALPVLSWTDDGAHGPALGEGKIGFRQMAPMIGEYSDFRVWRLF